MACRHREATVVELLKWFIPLEKFTMPCQEVLQHPNSNLIP
jgi:hypothetical protein